MLRIVFGFFFAFALLTSPIASAADLDGSDQAVASEEMEQGQDYNAAYGAWTCVAQSYASGLWYYWTAYNAYYARNMALNACVSQNGYTCNVNCRYGY